MNAMAKAIEDAIAALQYKDADFTDLQAAIDRANNLNKDNYKDFSKVEAALDAALQAVEEGRDITKQDEVNAMAEAIENAIASLEKKSADQTEMPSDSDVPVTGDPGNPCLLYTSRCV